MHVDVAKCDACHARWRWMSPSTCHTNSSGVHGVNRDPSTPPEPAQCHKCHACHAECPSVLQSATPATQNAPRRRQEPRATQTAAASTASIGTQARDQPAHWHKCTCHTECTSMSPSATPATQSEGRCRLAKCYACHAKWRSMSPSATPATQTAAATTAPGPKSANRASPVPQVPRLLPSLPELRVSKLCVTVVWTQVVCELVVCGQVVCVDKLCVSKLCVSKLDVSKLDVSSWMWASWMWAS